MRNAFIGWSHRNSLDGFGHHVIVHYDAAPDVDGDRVADHETVLLIGGDRLVIALVDGEHKRASGAGAFDILNERCADSAAPMLRIDIDLVQFDLFFLWSI